MHPEALHRVLSTQASSWIDGKNNVTTGSVPMSPYEMVRFQLEQLIVRADDETSNHEKDFLEDRSRVCTFLIQHVVCISHVGKL